SPGLPTVQCRINRGRGVDGPGATVSGITRWRNREASRGADTSRFARSTCKACRTGFKHTGARMALSPAIARLASRLERANAAEQEVGKGARSEGALRGSWAGRADH